MLRELPPQDELLKARDHNTIIVLPPTGWDCLFCLGSDGAETTVEWIEGPDRVEFGRCRVCGQHYVLADAAPQRDV